MKMRNAFLLAAVVLALPVILFLAFSAHDRDEPKSTMLAQAFWQHAISPGELSQAHASLENNCASCHTAVKGVDATKCIVCHADNKSLLARQPTAFHAEIKSCATCHLEHQGRQASITKMDHVALSRIGLKQWKSEAPDAQPGVAKINRWLAQGKDSPQLAAVHLQPEEALLNCATCHQTKDRHVGLFGTDCASCHATSKWTVAEFRHPSAASQSCAQCHQAPPSHYMMHFNMISMKVAGKPHAKVSECYACHQTTSWPDIKGVGWYKHH